MSARTTMAAVAAMLLAAGTGLAQTHATWPADWNNWADPALMVTVGNPGNAGELSGNGAGGFGSDRVCGAVSYVYRIGRFEVTAGQYCQFLNAVAKTDAHSLYNTNMADVGSGTRGCNIQRTGSSGSYVYSVAADWANRPVNYVSFWDACRFTNWLQNGQLSGAQDLTTTENGAYFLNGVTSPDYAGITRQAGWKWAVTSEDEWYKAAYHRNDGVSGNYWDFPTGTNTVPGRDMGETTKPGNNANYYSNGLLIGSPYFRTPVGEFQLSESAYGAFDQGGNLFEWTETGILRGGDYSGNDNTMRASCRGFSAVASYESSSWGFRVVEVPEPATLSLLALGGIALIRRKRR